MRGTYSMRHMYICDQQSWLTKGVVFDEGGLSKELVSDGELSIGHLYIYDQQSQSCRKGTLYMHP